VDEFLTVAEVAELLKLNPQTVRNWIDRGTLPAVRVGSRRVRIRKTDLDSLLNPGRARRPAAKESVEAVEAVLRDQLGTALREAHHALETRSDAELAAWLDRLALAARRLANSVRSG
jgi:excisionase family DNA binding protein